MAAPLGRREVGIVGDEAMPLGPDRFLDDPGAVRQRSGSRAPPSITGRAQPRRSASSASAAETSSTAIASAAAQIASLWASTSALSSSKTDSSMAIARSAALAIFASIAPSSAV